MGSVEDLVLVDLEGLRGGMVGWGMGVSIVGGLGGKLLGLLGRGLVVA